MRYLFTTFKHQIEIGSFEYLLGNEDEGLAFICICYFFCSQLLVVIAPERNPRFIEIILETFFPPQKSLVSQ